MNELDLIVACKNGNSKAQYELYKKYYAFLLGICLRYKSDKPSAEAALNYGFYKIMTNLDKYKLHTPIMSWMNRIMVNTLIDEYRKEKRASETFEYTDNYIQLSDMNSVDYNTAAQSYEAEELLEMIKNLPELSQKVFNMFAIDGYKHKEIAEILEIKVGTSRWHLSTARKLLKDQLLHSKNQNKLNYGK